MSKFNRQLVFVDVETANINNDTVCAICVITLNPDQKEQAFYSLVDPKTHFSLTNIQVHGIKPRDVCGCQSFECIWLNKILPLIEEDAVFVAHNAKFDINAIKKDLSRFNIAFPFKEYIDTMALARKYFYKNVVKPGDLKLNTLSILFNINLNHHNALSDTEACKKIFEILLNRYQFDIETEIKRI